jgi:hypothetical protein
LQFGNLVFVILLIYNQLMLRSPLPSALGIVSKKIHYRTLIIDVFKFIFQMSPALHKPFSMANIISLKKYYISELHCEAKTAIKNVILI